MTKLVPQPGIMDIALYQGGKSHVDGIAEILKLSSNENPLGPSTDAMQAIRDSAGQVHLYPSTDHAALRRAIAEVHGLDPDRIICGVGSDEVLQFVTQAFAGPGDQILHTAHGFSMYPILARMAGAAPICVPETDRMVDVDTVIDAITDKTRVILITNPGNPTGTMLAQDDLQRLIDAVPEDVVLVLDGAYAEYADAYDGGISLLGDRSNVLVTRTFSKIYGLGGLRIGWGYAARSMIDVLNRLRQPFNLSELQMAAAEAAVRDQTWVQDCAALNAAQRARLTGALRQLGLACDDSQGNFVLARFDSPDQARSADAALQAEGIIVRHVANYGFPEGLRITVGDAAQTGRVIDALTRWREDA